MFTVFPRLFEILLQREHAFKYFDRQGHFRIHSNVLLLLTMTQIIRKMKFYCILFKDDSTSDRGI